MLRLSPEWHTLSPEDQQRIERHQIEPPIKMSALAGEFGLTVNASTLPAGISGQISPLAAGDGRFLIRVNRHEPKVRQRFTVAHEIGHYLLHRELIKDGLMDDVLYRSLTLSNEQEAQANRLAADILMPPKLVVRVSNDLQSAGVDRSARVLAEAFEVSEAAMKIRLGIS